MPKFFWQIAVVAAAIGLLFLLLATADAEAQPTERFAVELSVSSNLVPGSIKKGDNLRLTIKVRNDGSSTLRRLQVGVPGRQPIKAVPGATFISTDYTLWSVAPLRPNQTKIIKFSVKVEPPPGASGPGMWCIAVEAAPHLMKGPPLWFIAKEVCFRILA